MKYELELIQNPCYIRYNPNPEKKQREPEPEPETKQEEPETEHTESMLSFNETMQNIFKIINLKHGKH